MERLSVTQAVRQFSDLINRVFYHGTIFAALSKQGKMIGAHDLMIAATAIAHNCAVLTENIREFARVPGLETVSFSVR